MFIVYRYRIQKPFIIPYTALYLRCAIKSMPVHEKRKKNTNKTLFK